MKRIEKEAVVVIAIILLVIIIPLGATVLFAIPEPYHVVTGDIISDAANKAGLNVASSLNTTLNFPGATSGKSYTITDKDGRAYVIYIQSFDSEKSRNAAIRLYNSHAVAKGRPPGEIIIVGDTLIYIPSPSGPIKESMLPVIKAQKAGTI